MSFNKVKVLEYFSNIKQNSLYSQNNFIFLYKKVSKNWYYCQANVLGTNKIINF